MTTTIAAIKTTLTARLGLDTLTTVEGTRLSEIVNAAVALVLGDSAPGLDEVMMGGVGSVFTGTVSSHSAGSAAVTLTTSPTEVRRGDIFEASDGNSFLVRSVAGAVVNLGIPLADAITGAVTITRRTLLLPDAGPVLSVAHNGHQLRASLWGGEAAKGKPSAYQQMWDAGESYILLFPAPETTYRFVVRQSRALSKDSTLDFPNGVIERILATAIVLYAAWTKGEFPVVERLRRDAADLSGESAGNGLIVKGGI